MTFQTKTPENDTVLIIICSVYLISLWYNIILSPLADIVLVSRNHHPVANMPSLVRYLQVAAVTALFLITYPLGRLFATLFPSILRAIFAWRTKQYGYKTVDPDDAVKTVASGCGIWDVYTTTCVSILYGEAAVWKPAPNPPVVKMDGVTQVNLLDLAKAGRPLVLNFGSCSWPPFMEKLAEVARLSHEYESIADFVTIYIAEAHATDAWAFDKNAYKIAHHKLIQDRIVAAQMLEEKKPAGQLVVDSMGDEANKLYRAMPERLCVVMDGVLQYYGRTGPFGYQPCEVDEWLKDYRAKQK